MKYLFTIIIITALLLWGLSALLSGENEGNVKYDDCRQIINIKAGDLYTKFHKFTCGYLKSDSGKIMSGGDCVHIDTQAGVCITAHVYTRMPAIDCGINAVMGPDDKCYCAFTNYKPAANGNGCIIPSIEPFTTPMPRPTYTKEEKQLLLNINNPTVEPITPSTEPKKNYGFGTPHPFVY